MAGRVNKKFVIGLVGAMGVVLAGGLFLFYQMVNKTGETHVKLAREAEAKGDWRAAEESWGRAVGHEKTNLDWLRSWQHAIEQVVPNTKTEYDNFFAEYMQIAKQIAVVARDQVAVTEGYLDLRLAFIRRMGTSDRRGVEALSNEIESLLAWYPAGGALEADRNRLRRYRGIAWASLSGPTSTITQAEIDSAKADLTSAVGVMPGDGETARALVMLLDTEKSRARTQQRAEIAAALDAEQDRVIDALLAANPEDPWGRLTRLEFAAEDTGPLTGAERETRIAELVVELSEFMDWLTGPGVMSDARVLERASLLEALLDPASNGARSIRLYEEAVKARDRRSDLVMYLAILHDRAGDYAKATEVLSQIEAQEWLPVSVEGILRMGSKGQAPRLASEVALAEIDRVQDEAEQGRLLDAARAARDRFVSEVGEDSTQLSMLDGQIATAEADLLRRRNDLRAAEDALNRALVSFGRFNELTEYANRNGLWREGRVATQLNKTGLAKDRFAQMLKIEPDNPNVLLALAEVEERLGTKTSLEEAYRLTERALELAPASETIRERLESLGKQTFRSTSSDPIEAMLFESERLMRGVDEKAPDAIGAEKVMRDGWAAHPGNGSIARQLVRVLMYSDRIAEAKTFVEQAAREFPNEPTIATLSRRLAADSIVDIVEIGIDESNMSELDKLVQKVEVFRRYGQTDRAKEALARAAELAPEDPDVVEQRFLQFMVEGDLESAAEVAEQAVSLNSDRLEGLTFQARLLAAKGDNLGAIELLREAVARRPTDAPLWRLLAGQQVDLGRINEALDSYRRALAISEADPATIRGYVATMATQGRTAEALAEARRLKEFGERDSTFLDMYLRLEATAGGEEGLATAIARRREILGERPFDTTNRLELANLYIEGRQWDQARTILDELVRESGKTLDWVQVQARWYADQGKVRTENGFEDGIDLARGAFVDYIVSGDASQIGVDAYIAMARFMIARGRDDVALRAVEEARPLQDPGQLRAEKLYGEIMMMRNLPRPAAEAFRRVVEAGADDAQGNYRKLLIEMLLRVNDFEGASAQLDSLPASAAEDMTVLMQRADIAMFTGQTEEALRIVDSAVERFPSQPLPFIKRAQYLMPNESLWRDAQRNLEEALRLSPSDPQAHRLMATMHYRQGRGDDAIASLRASLKADPMQDAVLIGLLIELIDKGRAGEALDVANEVIDKRSSDAALMLNTSRVFAGRGDFDRATVLLDRAWRLTKDQRIGLAYAQNLLASDPPKPQPAARVIADLEVLGVEINDDPIVLSTRAHIEQKSGKTQRATEFLSRAYEQSLENPGLVMQWFAEVRRTLGTEESGRDALRYVGEYRSKMPAGTDQRDWLTYGLALQRIQDRAEIAEAESDLASLQADAQNQVIKRLSYRLLGSGRFERQEYEAAAEAWRAGITAFPDDWEMHNNLAYCVGVNLDRAEEAIPLARQAAQLADARADVHDTLGTLHLRLGQLDQAEDAFMAARERQRTERERVTILLNLARLSLARGNAEEALRHWTDADTTVYTLPNLREAVGDGLDEVKGQIDSALKGG